MAAQQGIYPANIILARSVIRVANGHWGQIYEFTLILMFIASQQICGTIVRDWTLAKIDCRSGRLAA